jgi:SAM-dependent methyltransferase
MECMKKQTWRRRIVNGLTNDLAGHGIDVGAGRKPAPWWKLLGPPPIQVDTWDQPQGDAHHLKGVADGAYDFLFASHILEHLERPELALHNWVRVVRPGGVLLIAVPHRDLYEQKRRLPSRWNPNHKRFYLPEEDEPPDTVGLLPWLYRLSDELPFRVAAVQTGDWGYRRPGAGKHPLGEYQIDALLWRKP